MKCNKCKNELDSGDQLFCMQHRKKWRRYCIHKAISEVRLSDREIQQHLDHFIRR